MVSRHLIQCAAFLCVLFMSCGQEKNSSISKQVESSSIERVDWMTIEEAEKAMEKEAKDIYVMVYANWCPHCKKFDQTTYRDPKVIKDLNSKFYPVKLNAHANRTITYKGRTFSNPNYDSSKSKNELNAYHEIVYEIKAGSIPSIVFIDKNMTVKGTELGFKPAGELRSLMAMYKSN